MKTNRPIVWIAVMLMACLPLGGVAGAAESVDRYVWQTPRVSGIDREKVAPLLEELEFLVQQVLDAGPLAPLRTAYADIPFEAYYLYYERGRMITTLAWAYPHVAPTRQEGIRRYVRNLLADEQQAPWTPGILQKNQGAERRLYGRPVAEGRYVTYDKRAVPTLHVLYGLWLYGDRTGDWQIIQQNWDKIRGHYTRSAATEVFLYGQMSAHVAMARMAQRFGDAATLQIATAALAADLEAGRDTGVIEQRQRKTRYAWAYDERNAWAFAGQPWMFLDAAPEVLRFIADNPSTRQQALQRIDAIKGVYPLWWLHQAPYFTRWTGDEGIGTPPDLFGMVYAVERWVRQVPAAELALYMRSAPTGIGDCYWMEGLVQTIEAHGQLRWAPLTR
jgi:hypothetical protein